jgi:glycosyltransferase involved in cell wall biosynthesis
MKILYNHQIFIQKYGGASRYFFELANNIGLYKHKEATVRIISPFFKTNYLSNSNKNFLFNGIKVPDFKGSSTLCSIMNTLLTPILSRNYDPDIIHETYYNSIRQNKKRVKKIITVYDMIHELYPEMISSNDKTTSLKRFAVAQADHIICISRNTQKNLVDLFNIDIKKTSVIYLGSSLTKNKLNETKKTHRPYLLYVGTRHTYKNFARLLEAYAIPSIKNYFDLVLFGGGKLNKEEFNILNRLKIPIKSLKQVNGDDIVLGDYFKNASLFVYPSLSEGFGLPLLEAMNYGCPVVCSNTSSFPEIVGDAAILFDPYSVDSMRNNIISILENNTLRSSLVLKGFSRVKKFSWEQCARETFEVYKQVCK